MSVYDTAIKRISFNQKTYTATVKENVGLGTPVLTVKADGPGALKYSIVGGNIDNRFKIASSSSGQVTTEKRLDYELIKVYKLVVRATYEGTPEMAADVLCTVTIEDINDEIPRFAFKSDPEPVAVESYTAAGTNIIKVHLIVFHKICELQVWV